MSFNIWQALTLGAGAALVIKGVKDALKYRVAVQEDVVNILLGVALIGGTLLTELL